MEETEKDKYSLNVNKATIEADPGTPMGAFSQESPLNSLVNSVDDISSTKTGKLLYYFFNVWSLFISF